MDWFGKKLWRWARNADALDALHARLETARSENERRRREIEQLRTAVESLGRQPDAADQAYAELREQCSSNTDILAAYLDGSVEMVEQICQIAEDDRNGVVDFAAAEQGLKRGSAKVNSAALAALIEKGDDVKKRRADVRCPDCGEAAQHERRRERTLLSCFGHLKVRLHSWRCARCERTFRPREFQLGVDGGRKATRGMCRMLAIAGANQSFEDASTTLAELTGVRVNAKMVERETERLGRSMAAEEKADRCPATTTLTDDVAADATAYMEVDGTGVGMRPEETEGRAGKHADGRARTREAKLAVAWWERRRGQVESVSFSGAIESAAQPDARPEIDAPFWLRFGREATRSGFFKANRQVILGDGAPWIWNMADEMCPDAIQILDVFHVLEKMHDVCKDHYDSRESEFRRLRAWVKRGKLDAVVAEMKSLGADSVARYIDGNRRRMDYPRYRREGLRHSSSRVESACRNVIGARLKQSGMHWTVDGANAMLALRCYAKSKRLNGYFRRLHETMAERLTQCVIMTAPATA